MDLHGSIEFGGYSEDMYITNDDIPSAYTIQDFGNKFTDDITFDYGDQDDYQHHLDVNEFYIQMTYRYQKIKTVVSSLDQLNNLGTYRRVKAGDIVSLNNNYYYKFNAAGVPSRIDQSETGEQASGECDIVITSPISLNPETSYTLKDVFDEIGTHQQYSIICTSSWGNSYTLQTQNISEVLAKLEEFIGHATWQDDVVIDVTPSMTFDGVDDYDNFDYVSGEIRMLPPEHVSTSVDDSDIDGNLFVIGMDPAEGIYGISLIVEFQYQVSGETFESFGEYIGAPIVGYSGTNLNVTGGKGAELEFVEGEDTNYQGYRRTLGEEAHFYIRPRYKGIINKDVFPEDESVYAFQSDNSNPITPALLSNNGYSITLYELDDINGDGFKINDNILESTNIPQPSGIGNDNAEISISLSSVFMDFNTAKRIINKEREPIIYDYTLSPLFDIDGFVDNEDGLRFYVEGTDEDYNHCALDLNFTIDIPIIISATLEGTDKNQYIKNNSTFYYPIDITINYNTTQEDHPEIIENINYFANENCTIPLIPGESQLSSQLSKVYGKIDASMWIEEINSYLTGTFVNSSDINYVNEHNLYGTIKNNK